MKTWMKYLLLVMSLCVVIGCIAACDATDGSADANESTAAVTTDAESEAATTEAAATEPVTTAPETEPSVTEPEETDPPADTSTLIADGSKLSAYMQPILKGNSGTVKDETVFFIDKTDPYNTKTLLYPIKEVISVTSTPYYDTDGELTVYEEGKDYEVVDGKLVITPDSAIQTLGYDTYYFGGNGLVTDNEIEESNVWNSNLIAAYQVSVTYTTDAKWEGFTQTSYADRMTGLIEKLQRGEDITVFFYGDSITYGADSSYYINGAGGWNGNEQYPYALLFTEALADLFDYTVEFINVRGNEDVPFPVLPPENYVGGTGDRGKITYLNTAVGGMRIENGMELMDEFIKPYVEQYGCDLFVCGLGMNNAGASATGVKEYCETVIAKVNGYDPDAAIVMIATMLPHVGTNWESQGQGMQQGYIVKAVDRIWSDSGISCASVSMRSITDAVLEYKIFADYTGNNINHPNDFFHRLYAQTLLQSVIGYENLGF